jgi:uncharacterized membrane protein YgcG
MIKRIALAVLLLGVLVLSACGGAPKEDIRGKYVYDTADRLSLESELALASRLWQVDTKSHYEIVVVLPDATLEEDEIITTFNDMGIGKAERNNGAAIFIFPDNSWFVSIGSGNDVVSVPFSKTYGDKILTKENMDSDLSLTLIRYIEALKTQIDGAVSEEYKVPFWDKFQPMIVPILLWVLVLSLAVFLWQQRDGFQKHDLIVPIVLIVLLGIFVGISAASANMEATTYSGYGVVTSTQHDTHHWVETRVISTGKTTTTITVPHTDYINRTTIKDYDLTDYKYTFETTDNKGAWGIVEGDYFELTLGIESDKIYGAHRFSDNSGGQTIGDGAHN